MNKSSYDKARYEANKEKISNQVKARYLKKCLDLGYKVCDECGVLRPPKFFGEGFDTCSVCLKKYVPTSKKDKEKCVSCRSYFETATHIKHKYPTKKGNVCSKCYEPHYNGYKTARLLDSR